MRRLLSLLFAVYFLVSWKEYGCDANCPDGSSYWRGSNLILTPAITTDNGTIHVQASSCSMKVVEQEKRFETEKETDEFIKALRLTPLKEEMLDHPESLKWGFKKKKVTITEKEL